MAAASVPDPKLAAHMQQMKLLSKQDKANAKQEALGHLVTQTSVEVVRAPAKSKVPIAAAQLKDPLRDDKEIADLSTQLKQLFFEQKQIHKNMQSFEKKQTQTQV